VLPISVATRNFLFILYFIVKQILLKKRFR
jgi:hypothetical protein